MSIFSATSCRKSMVDAKPFIDAARLSTALDSTAAARMIDNDFYIRKYRSCYWNANVEQPLPELKVHLWNNGGVGNYLISGAINEDSIRYEGTLKMVKDPITGWQLTTQPKSAYLEGRIKAFGDNLFLQNPPDSGCDNYFERIE